MAKLFGERWQVIDPLGEGGQGWVYHVRDTKDTSNAANTTFVLKRLKNHSRLARFKREIEALGHLDHAGICRAVDFSLDDPAFIVMPFVAGKSLALIGQQRPLDALQLFSKLCGIVGYAHEKGVVHRDLKPDNILVHVDGQIVVLDFGLCYLEDEKERLTDTMEQVGSRFYMAPELESGRANNVTSKADVYSLGKTLYFMLSGRHLARENLENENDLVHLTFDPQLRYVTQQILKPAFSEAPELRPGAIDLQKAADNVARLITEHYYPGIDGSLCRFCGDGHYRRLKSHVKLELWETRNICSEWNFRPFRCDSCGNVQWFTPGE
jgi:serine/threonine protein kinase